MDNRKTRDLTGLLRACREWPRRHRTTNQCNELPARRRLSDDLALGCSGDFCIAIACLRSPEIRYFCLGTSLRTSVNVAIVVSMRAPSSLGPVGLGRPPIAVSFSDTAGLTIIFVASA